MNKTFTLIIICLAFINILPAQNYQAGKMTINFLDAARANREISTDVYYPAAAAGDNVPIAPGNDKFPVVVFGHGFLIPVSSYIWLADFLVKNGYIVALPSTEGGLSPSHSAFGADLLFLCNRLTSLNDSSTSFFYQRIIKKAAVAGHSMGGGSSFLAATDNNSAVKAIFNFAAAETNPSAIAAASAVTQPALIFSGSADCIVAPSVQLQMFTNVAALCKTYINVTGALHCQWANNNGTCSLGQLLSGCNSTSLNTTTLFSKANSLIVPFLDFYLKDLCDRGTDYLNAYDALTDVKNRTCNTFPECAPLPVVLQSFNGRLVNNTVTLKWQISEELNVDHFIVERSTDGLSFQFLQKINSGGSSAASTYYDAKDNYPYPGDSFYRLKIINKNGQYSTSAVVKISAPGKGISLTGLYPNPIKNNVQLEFVF